MIKEGASIIDIGGQSTRPGVSRCLLSYSMRVFQPCQTCSRVEDEMDTSGVS